MYVIMPDAASTSVDDQKLFYVKSGSDEGTGTMASFFVQGGQFYRSTEGGELLDVLWKFCGDRYFQCDRSRI